MKFELLNSSDGARLGRLSFPRGTVETPAFMPVGTYGTVKAMTPEELRETGAEIILGNTFHLMLRPGTDIVRAHGDLHDFMHWDGPILTDSGGFQVFSLAELRKITEQGVSFQSPVNGDKVFLSPEDSIRVQHELGADIIMVFDECTPYPADEPTARSSMELSLRWARRCHDAHATHASALFGIVQGGMYPALRREAAERMAAMDLPGYAIGGVSVGEPRAESEAAVAAALERLPADKPRYLMGVGMPEELRQYVHMGVDMMDCVLPTRSGRNGLAFTSAGRVTISNASCAEDPGPLDADCTCFVCRRYSRAYLRHLHQAGEMLGAQLLTHHNLHLYLDTMRQLRHAIELGALPAGGQAGHRSQ